jgi:hypothetical protein
MKIQILRDFETRDPLTRYTAGEAHVVRRQLGEAYVNNGLAVELPDDPAIPEGVEDAEFSESGD